MHIHKNQHVPAGNKTLDSSVKNVSPRNAVSTTQSARSVLSGKPMTSVIASSALSADKLSASIISFARFFSLSLKPELLASIRRQVIAQPSADVSQSEPGKQTAAPGKESGSSANAKTREALSLAAAAAQSKGVELHPKGLQSFAEAVDPDLYKRQNSDRQEQKRRNHQNENALNKTGSAEGWKAGDIEKLALESMENDPLLYILNRLPGKNGQRWIVLPFDFCEDGRNFRVSMRVLLEPEQIANRSIYMALDIVSLPERQAGTDTSEKRWLFVFEAANNKANRLTIYGQKLRKKEIQELSLLLDISADRVSSAQCADAVNDRLESFPFEAGLGEELLRSIDEVV